MKPANPTERPAFTLVELLVVISIIGLLIAIVVPSLGRSRAAARRTQCLARLRAVGIANMLYVEDFGRFPDLNNSDDDGTWQYNYLIFDGQDFNQNFGPLIHQRQDAAFIEQFYCPVQKDPFHLLNSPVNPWPVVPLLDTRAGYGRRYHLSGKSLSALRRTRGMVADVFHLPKLVESAHRTGVNAVYTDGHAQWVQDPDLFADNDLAHPFDVRDNALVKEIWKRIDEAGN